ncbi:uncharacterized protein EI90DRAFT_3152685 [Cantharellus anzutake]|uniref:uncharacterized protein n=1 Tax=Cantharellus anzutake TaxID=1750568 RepID=UPI001907134A|nr:uncharacterized protein EI90DRAFT_3152685 [Cantharellus anzutake]KAF8336565.1 hypothetical protein EI90DRAFT_3152685 [Cantharellus anzutake]
MALPDLSLMPNPLPGFGSGAPAKPAIRVPATQTPPTTPGINMDSSGLTEEVQPSQLRVSEKEFSATPEPQQTREAKITPASGPFDTPDDTEVSYNARPLPADFDYKVLGMHSPHLRLNVTDEACEAWNQANEHAVIIIPLYMAFSLTKMQEAKDHASTFIKRAFPDSAETLSTIPAANAIDAQGDDPLPWGIMIDGLTLCDAATLLYHQFWLSKAFSFVAHPASEFTSDWIGNWAFAATARDRTAVQTCLKTTLNRPSSKIGKYLVENVPDNYKRLTIIDSARSSPHTPKTS